MSMGIGISTFFVAVGAVLTFAVDANHRNGFNINSAGIILMIVGVLGLLVSMTLYGPRRRQTDVVEQSSPDGTVHSTTTTSRGV